MSSLTDVPQGAGPETNAARGEVRGDVRPGSGPRRAWTSRLSMGHVVMIVAGVTAALLNITLLRGGETTVSVYVAADRITAGAPVDASMFRVADLVIDATVAQRLLRPGVFDGADTRAGHLAATDIEAGEIVRLADLKRPASTAGLRAMSLPIEVAHAVGGAIDVGDVVDVIEVRDDDAVYIVAGARVLAIDRGSQAGLGSTAAANITLEVDAATALCLGRAVRNGRIEVVLSTGAEPVRATGCGATGSAPGATG